MKMDPELVSPVIDSGDTCADKNALSMNGSNEKDNFDLKQNF